MNVEILPGGQLPTRATTRSAGLDLYSAQAIIVRAGEMQIVTTGIKIHLPPGTFAMVVSRSGLAMRNKVQILNSPGIIDEDYRGEIKLLVQNWGKQMFRISRGDRIAQLVIARSVFLEPVQVEHVKMTARGDGGFGSTGR